jgi:hypothetical protein
VGPTGLTEPVYATLSIKYRCPPDVLQEAVEETISTIKAREEEQQEAVGPTTKPTRQATDVAYGCAGHISTSYQD